MACQRAPLQACVSFCVCGHPPAWAAKQYHAPWPDAVLQEVERYKAAFSRPGSLTAAIHYYRAAMRTGTWWQLPAAEK